MAGGDGDYLEEEDGVISDIRMFDPITIGFGFVVPVRIILQGSSFRGLKYLILAIYV